MSDAETIALRSTMVELPKEVQRYTLAGQDGNICSTVMTLNGKPLVLGPQGTLPAMEPEMQAAGAVELAPGTCTFLLL